MGLPPGVEVGGLGKRFRAHMTDNLRFLAAPPYLAALLGDNVGVIIQIAATVLMAACGLFVWQGLRVSRPGMWVIGLQLVGFCDGLPLGWVRFVLRALVLPALKKRSSKAAPRLSSETAVG